jgi:hypothetical protein
LSEGFSEPEDFMMVLQEGIRKNSPAYSYFAMEAERVVRALCNDEGPENLLYFPSLVRIVHSYILVFDFPHTTK